MKILEYFEYKHLPDNLQSVSKQFHDLAHNLVDLMPARTDQQEVALQKLLEAKDAAVRAFLPI